MMHGEIQYVVRHTNKFTYTAPISESMMEVRMQPRSDVRQRCLRFELTPQPRAKVFAYQDPYGNVVHHFDIPGRHARLTITADAVVQLAPAAELPESVPTATWDELDAIAASGERWEDLRFSHFARETPLLAELADEFHWRRDADALTLLRRLNYALVVHQGDCGDRYVADGDDRADACLPADQRPDLGRLMEFRGQKTHQEIQTAAARCRRRNVADAAV